MNEQVEKGDAGLAATGARIYDSLRHDILMGTLKPGRRVRIDSLSERYCASLNTLRDAVGRLTEEGLVEQPDPRVICAVEVSDDELSEIVRTRCWLEELAFTRSIKHRDTAWEERLLQSYDRMMRVPRSSIQEGFRVNRDWEARHRSFHAALIANCDSRPLLAYCRQLRDNSDRYRVLAAGSYSFPLDIVEGHHRTMMSAAIAGDTATATQVMRDHFEVTWTVVREAIQKMRSQD